MNLTTLQIGSTVIVSGSHARRIAKIDGETPTQWKIGNARFHKKNGHGVGDSVWNSSRIYAATDEELTALRAEIRLGNLQHKLCHYNYRALPFETLEALNALLPEENE